MIGSSVCRVSIFQLGEHLNNLQCNSVQKKKQTSKVKLEIIIQHCNLEADFSNSMCVLPNSNKDSNTHFTCAISQMHAQREGGGRYFIIKSK